MTAKKVGRSTKYKPEFVQALIDHFNVPAGTWKRKMVGRQMAQVYVPTELPLLQTFACSIGVAPTTVYGWVHAVDEKGALKYPELCDAYAEAKQYQQRILIHNGLNNSYKTAFAIFTMKNICGWRDALDLNHAGKAGGAIKMITATMSAQEAAEAYAETLRDGSKQ